MMSSMRSWHMRNIISHNLLLVMFIRLQHTCSTLHYITVQVLLQTRHGEQEGARESSGFLH